MAEKRSVVVTGASTCIGWSICKVLLAKGFRVFGSVRRQIDAGLQGEFGDAFTPLLMDVTDADAVHACARLVGEEIGRATLAGLACAADNLPPRPRVPNPGTPRALDVQLHNSEARAASMYRANLLRTH